MPQTMGTLADRPCRLALHQHPRLRRNRTPQMCLPTRCTMSSPAPTPSVASQRRRRSMTGPFILIIVGVIFLLGNLHLISWKTLGLWFAHYWPLLLILWGILKLVEHYRAKQEGLAAPGIGAGGVFLLIFLIVAGLTASQISRVNLEEIGDHIDIGDNDIPF